MEAKVQAAEENYGYEEQRLCRRRNEVSAVGYRQALRTKTSISAWNMEVLRIPTYVMRVYLGAIFKRVPKYTYQFIN